MQSRRPGKSFLSWWLRRFYHFRQRFESMNRKQRRTFQSLHRQRKLRLLPAALFSVQDATFIRALYPNRV